MTRRPATRSARPPVRLVPLEDAMRILGGHHPINLGIGEALPGVFDLKAIHAALDRKSGLVVELSHSGTAANDDTDADAELAQLGERIAAHAARRA